MFWALSRLLRDISFLSKYRVRVATLAVDGSESEEVSEEIREIRSTRRQALIRLSAQLILTAVVLTVAIGVIRNQAATEASSDVANTMVGFVLGYWFR